MVEAPNYYDLLQSKLDKVCTDSRSIQPGDIYLALKGERFDGNQFVLDAIAKGAEFAITDKIFDANDKVLPVNNTYDYLLELALYHRRQMKAKIFALTGTNGKTTTKELLLHIFNKKYNTLATKGNFNNHIGVPLTLLKLKPEHEFLILEMGANKPGDILELCRFSEPDYGLITNIGKAHLEGFGNEDGVLQTKTELFEFLKQQDKLVFINLDSRQLKQIAWKYSHRITYGSNQNNADFSFELLSDIPNLKIKLKGEAESLFYSSLFGVHNYENVMAAISVSLYFNLSNSEIQNGLDSYHPMNMRSQIIQFHSNTIIFDAYNANPSSMNYALNSFVKFEKEPKWVILGGMAELGSSSESEHKVLVEYLKTLNLQKIILIGHEFSFVRNKFTGVEYFENVEEAKEWLNEYLPQNSFMLVKGSRAVGLEKLLVD